MFLIIIKFFSYKGVVQESLQQLQWILLEELTVLIILLQVSLKPTNITHYGKICRLFKTSSRSLRHMISDRYISHNVVWTKQKFWLIRELNSSNRVFKKYVFNTQLPIMNFYWHFNGMEFFIFYFIFF